jgi:exopolysaccharide production protein ExoY
MQFPEAPAARTVSAQRRLLPVWHSPYRCILKRSFDVLAVLLAAPMVLPIILLVGVLIAHDGGPVFFCQARVGRGGRVFRMWKLRSMVVDAEKRLEDHPAGDPAAHAEWTETQKLKCDPRITSVGRLIRKSSLDELPQLWNVLMGEMSLVGPRPMLPAQTNLYPEGALRGYYELRPGLTGFWQISGRNETSFASRGAFDSDYARKLSLLTDIAVLIQTLPVVVRGTGY